MNNTNSNAALTIGTRIYYTGDVCNNSKIGTIAAVDVSKWGTSYRIAWDAAYDGETYTDSWIDSFCFSPGPGQRFMTLDAYQAKRTAAIAEMDSSMRKLLSGK